MIIVSSGEVGIYTIGALWKDCDGELVVKSQVRTFYSTGTQGLISACAVYESVQSGKFWGEGKESFPFYINVFLVYLSCYY